jgi:predicted NACHT family NTPase
LEFGIGKVTAKSFLKLKFNTKKTTIYCDIEEWGKIKFANQSAIKEFGSNIIIEKIEEIDKVYSERINTYEKCIAEIASIVNQIDLAYKDYKKINNPQHLKLLDDQIEKLKIKKLKLENRNVKPKIVLDVDFSDLENDIYLKQKWLMGQISRANTNQFSVIELREFLCKCHEIFAATDLILKNEHIAKTSGVSENQIFSESSDIPRLSIPIEKVFDTRKNIFVLGEAGAGKSTTLHFFTKNKLSYPAMCDDYIFLPLARVFEGSKIKKNKKAIDYANEFICTVVEYYMRHGICLSVSEFQSSFEDKEKTLLLDGLDEIISKAPWVIQSINELVERYPKLQIIVSSRSSIESSSEYANKIPFIAITLLPFTDAQRCDFIKQWFLNDKNKARKLITHVKSIPELSSVVRLPLLTTILCRLMDYSIPLPKSETRLYQERFMLLLGHYDIYKKTQRVRSSFQVLEVVARKIAFYLHSNLIRYDTKDDLLNSLKNTLRHQECYDNIILALNELIDPCNILIPMTDNGGYGFGHLRYQEYLVATELCRNRNIDIYDYLNKLWWRDALILFSEMTDSLDFILVRLLKKINREDYYETVKLMIEVRPLQEKKGLLEMLRKHKELDSIDPLSTFEFEY